MISLMSHRRTQSQGQQRVPRDLIATIQLLKAENEIIATCPLSPVKSGTLRTSKIKIN